MVRKGCQDRAKEAGVGVILCGCGGEMARLVQMDSLERSIRANRQVRLLATGPYPCSKTEIEKLGAAIAKRKLDRIVVAGCSERLFGRFFRTELARFGVEPSLVAFADIKDLSALVHRGSKAARTARALDLVRAAVTELATASRLETIETAIRPACVVLGGGVAGCGAAVALASRGVKVVLVESRDQVGGMVRDLNVVYPSYQSSGEFVEGRRAELEAAGVQVITGMRPVAVKGHVGDFEIELEPEAAGEARDRTKLNAGAIIVATGASLLVPAGLFGYGQDRRVITQMDLEAILRRGENPGKSIVMIQCAGSRIPERPYCSRVCCTASIVNTIFIKQKFPDAKITVLSRGFAEYAGDLDRARQMGVEIIRYSPERAPQIKDGWVEVYDEISEMEARIPFDLVVLAVAMVPSESTKALAKMVKMPTDVFGFMLEPHLKLRPEEAVPRGIFVAGCAHWPATITESIVQAYSAASRAFDLIKAGKVARAVRTVNLDAEYCRGCGKCAEVCQHGAIDLVVEEDGLKRAQLVPIACTGCGVCVSVCPSGAATISPGSRSRPRVAAAVNAPRAPHGARGGAGEPAAKAATEV
ncbi:MAG TPA: 4Fe-4S binding protein [bacterium]|nr:4Fe-4S binding protein [bacterium]